MTINTVYERGAFWPKDPVELPEHSEVAIQYHVGPAATESPQNGGNGKHDDARSIEDEIAAIVADVPAEEWHGLPDDLLDHLDHYLYGAPKT